MHSTIPSIIVLDRYYPELPDQVGSRAASRAFVHQLKIPSPKAFAVTEAAFYQCIHHSNYLQHWIRIFSQTKPHDLDAVVHASRELQQLIHKLQFPEDFTHPLHKTYSQIIGRHWAHITISPTKLTKAPTFVPVPTIKGEVSLLDFLRRVWAVQLSPHALSLYLSQSNSHLMPLPTVMVSEFEPAVSSGKVYSIDPRSLDKQSICIEAIWGTNPQPEAKPAPYDRIVVTKDASLCLTREIHEQNKLITTDRYGRYIEQNVAPNQRLQPKCSDEIIPTLCSYVQKIHNSQLNPVVINWLTTKSGVLVTRFEKFELPLATPKAVTSPPPSSRSITMIGRGLAISPGIATAPLTIFSQSKLDYTGRIVLLKVPDTQALKKLKLAAGLVIEQPASDRAFVTGCREIGIPAVTGIGDVTAFVNHAVTVDGSKGEVYQETSLPEKKAQPVHHIQPAKKVEANHIKVHATKIYLNTNTYNKLDELHYAAADGVGSCCGLHLLTPEQKHPRWLIERSPKQLRDTLTKQLVDISQAFGDRPVWYYLYESDSLHGSMLTHGKPYEPTEYNPTMGFRGAARISVDNKVTEFELRVIKDVIHTYHCRNISIVVPFVRNPQEYRTIKQLIAGHGLTRSHSFKLSAEIVTPSAVSWIRELIDQGIDTVHVNLDSVNAFLWGYDWLNPEVNKQLMPVNNALLTFVHQLVTVASLHKLPLIATSTYADHYKDVTAELIQAGITALVCDPHHIDHVVNWVETTESKIATSNKL